MHKSTTVLLFLTTGAFAAAGYSQIKQDSGRNAPRMVVVNQQGQGKYGFINNTGIIIPPQFDLAREFSEGLAWVKKGNLLGYIDSTGRMAIKPQFVTAEDFSEGLAAVSIDGKTGYIDKTGQFVIPPQFQEAHAFSDGLARVRKETLDSDGYIDRTGRMVIKPQFGGSGDFSEGLATIPSRNGARFIDKTGQIVIQTQFRQAWPFSDGLARVSDGTMMGYIDKTGRVAINLRFVDAHDFSEGLAAVRIGAKRGYIDKSGRMAIEARFDGGEDFSEGLAVVLSARKYSYIDKTGRVAINRQFDGAKSFFNGLAWAIAGTTMGYIDKRGEFVWSSSPLALQAEAQRRIAEIETTSPAAIVDAWVSARNSNAIAYLRTINTVEAEFVGRSKDGTYGDMNQLITAKLLDTSYTSPKEGHRFGLKLSNDGKDYVATATAVASEPGWYDYYTGPDGVIRYTKTAGRAPKGAEGQPAH